MFMTQKLQRNKQQIKKVDNLMSFFGLPVKKSKAKLKQ